ncbi:MAG: 5-hydroxyisourate hydrolase [Conexibacter sp.]|nr:5-hydroxyisourate hydrolase [Conexibacter sp.]
MTHAAGHLTTHVLDVARGRPAAGVAIELVRMADDDAVAWSTTAVTNADGRTDAPLVAPGALQAGRYELRFAVGPYFALTAPGDALGEPPFLDVVPVRFGIADPDAHHHVPLLVTPWSYSTYRGS